MTLNLVHNFNVKHKK